MLRLTGSFAAPIPAAETGVLGGWLLAGAGLPLPEGAVSVVSATAASDLSLRRDGDAFVLDGTAERVAWGRSVERVAILTDVDGTTMVASVSPGKASVTELTNMAGEPRDSLRFDSVRLAAGDVGRAADGATPDALLLRGALCRATQMAGALERMSQLTVDYTAERQQFGRPVGRFQAVQQHLVWGAQHAALVSMAADGAAREAERGDAWFEIASAKLLANQGAGSVFTHLLAPQGNYLRLVAGCCCPCGA